MSALYLGNIVVVAVAGWAVWERRLTFGSRWDAPITVGIVLFGLGAVLDSPWPAAGAASLPLTGRYYLLMAAGHVCYLLGAAMGIKAAYQRLLSDEAIGPFLRERILAPIAATAVIMAVCIWVSPLSATMTVEHLYLAKPDGPMAVYWIAFLGGLAVLELISLYGASRLRCDPRSVMVNLLMASQAVGTLAIASIAVAVLTGHGAVARILVWPLAYAGIIGGSVAAVVSWRHRVRSMRS